MDFLPPEPRDIKHCLSCGGNVSGRMGKKFCSDQCRAQFHNKKKNKDEKWIKGLNSLLRKNRTILKNLNPVGLSTVRQEVLKKHQFDFRFYTHQFKTRNGATYYFCYEWGYQILPEGKVLIVNWQDYMKPVSSLAEERSTY
jgi:predicted nucleic acid-binding Zn ribbon protein